VNRIVACLGAAALASAVPSAGRPEVIRDFEIAAGLELADYNYHESHLMRLDGAQFGVWASARCLKFDPWMPVLDVSFLGGDITYDGGTDTTSVKDDVGNSISQVRPLLGYKFEVEDFFVTPFSGLGFWYLVNRLDDLGSGGYKRQQFYLYWPWGATATYRLPEDDKWELSLRMEWDILLYGYNHSGSPVAKTFTQCSGWAFEFAPGIRCDINDKLALLGEIYFRYWKVGDSDTVGGYKEPENSTRMLGIRAGVAF